MNTRTFGDIGAAVLQILTEKQEIDMKLASAREVSQPIRTTPSRPEIPDALEEVKHQRTSTGSRYHSPREGMEQKLDNAGISEYFERQLSV